MPVQPNVQMGASVACKRCDQLPQHCCFQVESSPAAMPGQVTAYWKHCIIRTSNNDDNIRADWRRHTACTLHCPTAAALPVLSVMSRTAHSPCVRNNDGVMYQSCWPRLKLCHLQTYRTQSATKAPLPACCYCRSVHCGVVGAQLQCPWNTVTHTTDVTSRSPCTSIA
jgi:hypothetical protein